MDTALEAERFREDGYAVFEGALAGAPLARLRTACDAAVAAEEARLADVDPGAANRLSRPGSRWFVNECQRTDPSLRAVLFGPELAAICAATLGADAYFFLDQFVVKAGGFGAPFGWHQDSGYMVFNGGPADHAPYLTCWCALDDASADNGAVRLAPFTVRPDTRGAVLPHRRDPGSGDVIAETEVSGALTVPARAGDVVVFSSRLLHATGANASAAPRRVYLAQYTPHPILDPGGRHLRRNAIPLLRDGRQTTFG